MKYVMFETRDELKRRIPVIFPNYLVHNSVAKAMGELITREIKKEITVSSAGEVSLALGEILGEILDAIDAAERAYKILLAKKWRPQEARSVFPTGLAAKIGVTGNVRNWRHAMLMRTSAETHPQFRQVTIPLLEMFQRSPLGLFFEDVIPNSKQSDNLKKMR